jgi:hypothetical protein
MSNFRKSEYFYLDQREYVGSNVTDYTVDGKSVFGGGFPYGLSVGSSGIGVNVDTLAGTTSGTIYYSEPFRGDGYKKVIMYFDGYENTTSTAQEITFPTPFTFTPYTVENGTGMTVTITGSSITFPASMSAVATDAYIILEGI